MPGWIRPKKTPRPAPTAETTNTSSAITEIIAVLHKYKVPISVSETVFEKAMEQIRQNTIPYNPYGGESNEKF